MWRWNRIKVGTIHVYITSWSEVNWQLQIYQLSLQVLHQKKWPYGHVTNREASSGTVIHTIFDMWQYEVLWTCGLTRLLWYAFHYVHSILYIILRSTKQPNALHCTLPSKLSSRSQAHYQAHSQVPSQLHLMTLPACLTIHFQVSFQNALKHTPV